MDKITIEKELLLRLQIEQSILFLGEQFDSRNNQEVLDFKWNCVFTSLKGKQLADKLSNDTRRVKEVISEEQIQSSALDKKFLHIVRLYGCGNEDINSDLEKDDMDDNAQILMRRMVEIIKRQGIILIDGYSDNDILPIKELRRAIRKLNQGQHQVFWFSYNKDRENEYVNDLINDGIVYTFQDSLSVYFREYFDKDNADFITYDIDKSKNVHIFINGKPEILDKKDLFESENFSTLLHFDLLNETIIPPHMYKDYFYLFLKNSIREPQWYGYRYNFNLERYYEDTLLKCVNKCLEKVSNPKVRSIMISGQTGSGKSIALASLAYKVFNEKKYPVIFMNDPNLVFSNYIHNTEKGIIKEGSVIFNALDALIKNLEDKGAKAVLLIWDTSSYSNGREKNYKLYQALLARGRKVFLVSTSYEIYDHEVAHFLSEDDMEMVEEIIYKQKFSEIKVSVKMENENANELQKLKDILVTRGGISESRVEILLNSYDSRTDNFLALLYRFFENIRNDLAQGVYREANMNIKELDKVIDNSIWVENSVSVFAEALLKAGVQIQENNNENREDGLRIAVNQFARILAVCSQFKLKVPYDLALRILGTYDPKIINLLMKSSFFVITEKYDGDYEISIRTPLEAELFLISKQIAEIDQIHDIVQLISMIKIKGEYGQQTEVKLVESIIRIIGPNNKQNNKRYRCGYNYIIDELCRIREEDGINEPHLIAQEITFMREYYGKNENLSINDRIIWLEKAIDIADHAIADMGIYGGVGIRNSLIVEATNSKLILCQIKDNIDINTYREIKRDLQEVIRYDYQNIHAYVTLLRSSISEYKNCADDIKTVEMMKTMCSLVDQINCENKDVADSSYFQQGVTEIYGLLDNTEIQMNYVDELAQNGSAAGLYVLARKLIRDNGVDYNKCVNNKIHIEACRSVYSLFNNSQYKAVVSGSASCQYMLLNITWLIYNKEPIFQDEECWLTRMSDDQWLEILNICTHYIDTFLNSGFNTNQSGKNIRYLQALCFAQLKQYKECLVALKSIGEDSTLGIRRIYTKHMICEPDGTPRKFKGTLGKYNVLEGRGYGYIEEFGKEGLYYHAPHLYLANIDEGTFLTDLEVGLNYISPRIFREVEKRRKKS